MFIISQFTFRLVRNGLDQSDITEYKLRHQIYFHFQAFFKGYRKVLKSEGRADTKHNAPLINETHERINNMLAHLQIMMEIKDKNSEEFLSMLDFLPEGSRNDWHRLVQMGVIFIIMIHHGRRAREGIDSLKKEAFEPVYNAATDTWVIVKVLGEISKNNQDTDEDLEKGPVIRFKTYPNGKNNFLASYLKTNFL